MSKRINMSVDDETAELIFKIAKDENRTDAGAALRLIKEALAAREKAKERA